LLDKFFELSDSYIGMDQQLDLKLDVKEAPAIPQYSGRIKMIQKKIMRTFCGVIYLDFFKNLNKY
jgi:hypothetical protein